MESPTSWKRVPLFAYGWLTDHPGRRGCRGNSMWWVIVYPDDWYGPFPKDGAEEICRNWNCIRRGVARTVFTQN